MATASIYETLTSTDKIWFQERKKRIRLLIRSIYSEVKGGKILDVAMGRWSLVKGTFPKLFVVGVDNVSPSHPPDEFYLVDLKKGLPFKDEEFSMVFAGEIIEHMGDQAARNLVKEIFRVLRTNGFLILTTPNGFRNKFKAILRRPKIVAHEKEFSFREMNEMLVKAGFEIVHSEGIQPVFVPWRVTSKFTSLKLHGLLSSQLIFLCKKTN